MISLKYVGLFLLILYARPVNAQDSLIISGNIDKILNHRYLAINIRYDFQYEWNKVKLADTCEIMDGKYNLKLPVKTFESYKISLIESKLIDTSNTGIQGNLPTAYLRLKPTITTINFLDTGLKKYEIIGNEQNKKKDALDTLVSGARFAPHEIKNNILNWLKTNPKDLMSAAAIKMLVKKIPDEDIIRLFNELPDSLKLNSTAQDINYYLENLTVGKKAPNFTQENSDGKLFNLSDLRGKVVLIEFSASWCVPCRQEIPYLKKAYNKYKNEDFTIVTVSLDHKRELWIDAIKRDNLQWLNVSDLKGWENKVSSNLYKISAIPSNFLLDQNGKIIAKNLNGKDLLIKLQTLKL